LDLLLFGSTSARSSGTSGSAKMIVSSTSVSPFRMNTKSAAECSAWSTKKRRFARANGAS
jgi:hypothetical protein